MESSTDAPADAGGGRGGRTSRNGDLPRGGGPTNGVYDEEGSIYILLVEDDDDDALLLEEAVEDAEEHFDVLRVARLSEVEPAVEKTRVDVVLLDLRLPDASGIEMIARLHELMPRTPVVVLTGMTDEHLATEAIHAGAQDYLSKRDATPDAIRRAVSNAIERQSMTNALEDERQRQLELQETLLSHVSHELRTPLTAIYQFTANLQDGLVGDMTDDQSQVLAAIMRNIKHLQRMMDELLDATRAGEGTDVNLTRMTIDQVLSSTIAAFEGAAAAKGLELTSSAPDGIPAVLGDPDRIRQVLGNLVSNAIKFTNEGGVHLGVSYPEDDDTTVRIFVRDSGPGIPRHEVDSIFDRLYQVEHEGGYQARKGLGLGLYICQQIMSNHDGRIWATSEVGEGSEFSIELSVHPIDVALRSVESSPTLVAIDPFAGVGVLRDTDAFRSVVETVRNSVARAVPDVDLIDLSCSEGLLLGIADPETSPDELSAELDGLRSDEHVRDAGLQPDWVTRANLRGVNARALAGEIFEWLRENQDLNEWRVA